MRYARRRGFTLIELLMAIAVVLILVAIITMGYGHAMDTLYNTQCVHNLKTLHDAFRMRLSDETTGEVTPFVVKQWPGALVPYTEGRGEFLRCPVHTPTEEEFVDIEPVQDIIEVGNRVADRVEVKVVGGGGVFYEKLEPGPWVIKYSDTQYNEARARGLLNNDASANDLRRKNKYTDQYIPDGTGLYWLCVEDHGGDDDYKDVMIKVTDNQDGTVELWIRCGSTGHKNSLVDADTGEEIMRLPSNTEGLVHVLYLGGGFVGGGGTDSGVVRWRGASSYALNADFRTINDGRKVLALDYATYLASSTDLWDDPDMDPNGDGVPIFARHFGRMNILRVDGSVDAVEAEEIDPARPSVAREVWLP